MTDQPLVPLQELIPEWYVYERTEQSEPESFQILYRNFQEWRKNLPGTTCMTPDRIQDLLNSVSEQVKQELAEEISNNPNQDPYYLQVWRQEHPELSLESPLPIPEILEFVARKARQDMVDVLLDISLARSYEELPETEDA